MLKKISAILVSIAMVFALVAFPTMASAADVVTITYNGNGGTFGGINTQSTQQVYAGQPIPAAAQTFTWAGYLQTGWNTKADGTGQDLPLGLNSQDFPATVDETIYALWSSDTETQYAVTVNGAGTGASGAGSYVVNAPVTVTAGTPATGMQFDSWTATGITLTDPTSSSVSFLMPANGVTLTANWKTQAPADINVTTSVSGTPTQISKPAGSTVASLGTAAAPDTDHTFSGWALTEGGTALDPTTPLEENTTYYAVFSQNAPADINVTTSVSGTPTQISKPAGSTVGDLGTVAAPDSDHTFSGWALTDGGTPLASSTPLEEDQTYYAVFSQNAPADINVTTSVSGTPTPMPMPAGSIVGELGTPAAPDSDHTFSGWALTDGGATLDNATLLEEGQTYYAVFSENQQPPSTNITVNVVDANGTTSAQDFDEDATVASLGTLSKSGYDFAGWATSPDGSALDPSTLLVDSQTYYPLFTLSSTGGGNQGGGEENSNESTTPAQAKKTVTTPAALSTLAKTGDDTAIPAISVMALLIAASAALMASRRRRGLE